MGKKTVYTKITPLPVNVPRQLALDMLHSHVEVIELNPLVTGVRAVDAPRDAVPDEYFSQWYEISEIITWGFGLKKKIAFKGVFHDQPWGLQTHVYAPMGVDMRNRYSIGGNQPGEPREARELGLDIPLDGLYLREDVEIVCSVPMTTGFVKKEAMAATGIMVQRLTRKAELLDEGKLHAMFEQGLLKTAKPNMTPAFADRPPPSPSDVANSPILSPTMSTGAFFPPTTDAKGFGRYHDIVGRTDHRSNRNSYVGPYQNPGYNGSKALSHHGEMPGVQEIYEMPGSMYQPQSLYPQPLRPQGSNQHFGASQTFTAELPGDNTLLAPPVRDSSGSSTQASGSAPSSPQLQYAAYVPSQNPPHSPSQVSPGHPTKQSVQRALTYERPTAPPTMQHPAHRNSSSTSWQSSGSTSSPSAARESRTSSVLEPDHAHFAGLSIKNFSKPSLKHEIVPPPTMSKCPVCGLFEGDESAVTHHVTRTHFA
nr:hypothetical protein CFP56_72396 [Quercus suber]